MRPTAFLSLRKVYFDIKDPLNPVERLLGRTADQHSILRDVSIELPLGAQVCVYGLSGSGKSTLLRLLTGVLKPSQGDIQINGRSPAQIPHLAEGYISSELTVPHKESGHQILQAFGEAHQIANLPAKIGELAQALGIADILHQPAEALSTTQRLRLFIARVALADVPVVLLDDVTDHLGVAEVQELLKTIFAGRTCLIATRHTAHAEALDLPIMLLHDGTMAYFGTRDEIANLVACERLLDVWVEGLRYDLLRTLKQHTGVLSVRLIPSSRFAGQRLRIALQSARYLPSLYNALSQASLVRVQELPPSLNDILNHL